MTLAPATRSELERLLSVCYDDEPTEAEQARLNELLRSDVACRMFYLRYTDLHARLLQGPSASSAIATVESNQAADGATPLHGLAVPARSSGLRPYIWMVLAAAVVLPISRYMWVKATVDPQPAPAAAETAAAVEAAATDAPEAVAESPIAPDFPAAVLASDAAVWSDRLVRNPGLRLQREVFQLDAGQATLQFGGGARLTLYGPATLRVESSHSAVLIRGRIRLRGDGSLGAFELLTPQARWVDEGAEYGAIVTTQTEELHIFAGEVLRTARPELINPPSPIWLAQGQARQFIRDGDWAGTTIPFDAQGYAESKPQQARPLNKPASSESLIAYDSFEPKTLHQWRGTWTMHDLKTTAGEFRNTFGLRHAAMTEPGEARMLRGRVVVSRPLPTPVRTDVDGAYYFSFLVRCGRISPEGEPCDVQLSFRSSGDAEPQHKLSTTLSWSKNGIAVGWENGGRQASVPLDAQRVYAVVGKMALADEQPDQLFVRLYGGKQSLSPTEPIEWTVVSLPVTSRVEFDTVQWSSANTYGITVDELRLGSTWSSVAGPYELPIVVESELGKQLRPTEK